HKIKAINKARISQISMCYELFFCFNCQTQDYILYISLLSMTHCNFFTFFNLRQIYFPLKYNNSNHPELITLITCKIKTSPKINLKRMFLNYKLINNNYFTL